MLYTKQQIPLLLDEYFTRHGCKTPSLFITLNSRDRVYSPDAIEAKSATLSPGIAKLITWINEYCFGRRSNKKTFAVGFFEFGDHANLLHCHLLVATTEESSRSVDEVGGFIDRKWERFLSKVDGVEGYLRAEQTAQGKSPQLNQKQKNVLRIREAMMATQLGKYPWEFDNITKVVPIYELLGVQNYCSKKFNELARFGDYCSLEFF